MKKLRRVVMCAVLSGAVAATGCALRGGGLSGGQSEPDQRRTQAVVRMGLVPVLGVSDLLDRAEPLAEYLSGEIGARIELVPMRTYEKLEEELGSGELDLGVSGSLVGYRAIKDVGAVPLARPETDGSSTYEGLILVRADSGITALDELKGKGFGMIRATSAGELYPRYLLAVRKTTAESFFGSVVFLPKHADSVRAVLDRQVDGSAVKNHQYEKAVRDDPSVARALRVIAKSEARFPNNVVIASRALNVTRRETVRRALLGAGDDPRARAALEKYGADRFVPTSEADYAAIKRMAEVAGL